MVHMYTEAVTLSPRIVIKRRLCLSAKIRSSGRHAKALLYTSPQPIPQFTICGGDYRIGFCRTKRKSLMRDKAINKL